MTKYTKHKYLSKQSKIEFFALRIAWLYYCDPVFKDCVPSLVGLISGAADLIETAISFLVAAKAAANWKGWDAHASEMR